LEEDLNLDPDIVFDKAALTKQQWFNQLLDLVPTMPWLSRAKYDPAAKVYKCFCNVRAGEAISVEE